jgi:hypothetical protein
VAPATETPSWTTHRATLAGYLRQGRRTDDPAVVQARRALALARTELAIREAIEQAPPLDAETLARIRALIPAPSAVAS